MLPKSSLKLKWKSHNINIVKFTNLINLIEPSCCGISAGDELTILFDKEISEEIISIINSKWLELDDPEHEICKSYKSREQLEAELLAKKQSAKAKLAALGLDAEEVAALLG